MSERLNGLEHLANENQKPTAILWKEMTNRKKKKMKPDKKNFNNAKEYICIKNWLDLYIFMVQCTTGKRN